MAFDQDAVDEAVRLLQPQIDELKAQIADLTASPTLQIPDSHIVNYPDGTAAIYERVVA